MNTLPDCTAQKKADIQEHILNDSNYINTKTSTNECGIEMRPEQSQRRTGVLGTILSTF